jgi:NitT/TauT family transport system ATP-binding protein
MGEVRQDNQSATASANHIALRDIGKSYGKGSKIIPALESITLDIGRGEFLSILGPSGCGKSTLLMMIAGLVAPSRGAILVGGRPVHRPLTDIGIAFQQDLLFDWRTVLGNVMVQADMRGLDRTAAKVRARTLLDRVGLREFEHRHPWELSGGMRQRVAICRALLHGASVLLMDESSPTDPMDGRTADGRHGDAQHFRSGVPV